MKKSKIIITQSALRVFAGSEIVTLELADFLQSNGMDVVVFTWYLADPMKSEFEKKRIRVTDNSDDPLLDDPDYVWVHHQVIPNRVLETLHKASKKPKFIFHHMSAIENLYLEQNYIYDLERRLSSKSLFVSDEARNFAKNYYIGFSEFNDTDVFANFATKDFLRQCSKKIKLEKILIVSNHSVEEFGDVQKILNEKGLKAEFLGACGSAKLVTFDVLDQYDLIISIGKTVQYSLCMGLPVYVYDHFGGPGYLNSGNFEQAARTNFSGRGFSKKSTEEIVEEIISGYAAALEFQTENRKKFVEKYSLKNNIKKVFNNLKSVKITQFTEQYLHYIEGAENITRDKIIAENGLVVTLKERDEYREAYKKSQIEHNALRQELDNIKSRKAYNVIRGIDKARSIIQRTKH